MTQRYPVDDGLRARWAARDGNAVVWLVIGLLFGSALAHLF